MKNTSQPYPTLLDPCAFKHCAACGELLAVLQAPYPTDARWVLTSSYLSGVVASRWQLSLVVRVLDIVRRHNRDCTGHYPQHAYPDLMMVEPEVYGAEGMSADELEELGLVSTRQQMRLPFYA